MEPKSPDFSRDDEIHSMLGQPPAILHDQHSNMTMQDGAKADTYGATVSPMVY